MKSLGITAPGFTLSNTCVLGRRIVSFTIEDGELIYRELVIGSRSSHEVSVIRTNVKVPSQEAMEVACCFLGGEILVIAEPREPVIVGGVRFAASVIVVPHGSNPVTVDVVPLSISETILGSGRPFLCRVGGNVALLQHTSSPVVWYCAVCGSHLVVSEATILSPGIDWLRKDFWGPAVCDSNGALFTVGARGGAASVYSISLHNQGRDSPVVDLPVRPSRDISLLLVDDRFLIGGGGVIDKGKKELCDFWVVDIEYRTVSMVSGLEMNGASTPGWCFLSSEQMRYSISTSFVLPKRRMCGGFP